MSDKNVNIPYIIISFYSLMNLCNLNDNQNIVKCALILSEKVPKTL